MGLKRFLVDPEPEPERCELCATPVPHEHPHLVHVTDRRLLCACGPCAFLFDDPGAGNHRRVPDRYLADPAFALDDGQWDALQIPVGMAFCLHNSVLGSMVAFYPSPAGATESELPSSSWAGISPLAAELAPDVEALLVRREPSTCLLVPIDACYRLVGLVRLHWRGFDGGAQAHAAIDAFFTSAVSRARSLESS
jgi:hypothetical protein